MDTLLKNAILETLTQKKRKTAQDTLKMQL